MTTFALTRRYLDEYTRRPLNLALLVAVPVIFVTLTAGALADFARILGADAGVGSLTVATAGWAASFIAGVAGFFHVRSSDGADRRLAAAGLGAGRVVTARFLSGILLGVLAAAGALAALALRTGIDDPARVIGGTLLFASTYLALGVLVGAVVRSDVNGSLLVIFVWMLDVFLGPGMAGNSIPLTRVFPTHYTTLMVMNAPSGHAGPLGDIGWALVWLVGLTALAAAVFSARTRPAEPAAVGVSERSPRLSGRWRVGLRFMFREHRRNPALWVLLVALPLFFITVSFAVTPDQPTPVKLIEGGRAVLATLSMTRIHGAIMVPITVAFLAGLAGLFVVQGSKEADRRLTLAGFHPAEVLAARLGVILAAAGLATVVSLAVTAIDFTPDSWWGFAAATGLTAATYGLIGVLVGSVFGRLGGLYVMFLLPFIDVGLAQNPMFGAAPPGWARAMPGNGAIRLLIDAAFTPTIDDRAGILIGVAWLAGIAVLASVVFRRLAKPAGA